MKIVAHYRNEQLQHKGWHSLEKFRPSKFIEDGYSTTEISFEGYLVVEFNYAL